MLLLYVVPLLLLPPPPLSLPLLLLQLLLPLTRPPWYVVCLAGCLPFLSTMPNTAEQPTMGRAGDACHRAVTLRLATTRQLGREQPCWGAVRAQVTVQSCY